MKKKIPYILRWLLPLLLVVAGLFLYSTIPTQFLGLVSFALAGLVCLYFLLGMLERRTPMAAKVLRSILSTFVCFGLVIVMLTGLFVGASARGDTGESCDYIVVLGAKVNGTEPSRILRQRIDAAESYLISHPDTIAVLSGGQGPDEGISEAQCMYNELTARGIAPERLLLEDQSTSTLENLRFSLAMLERAKEKRPEKLGVVSSEFHLHRAGIFAESCGVEAVGIPAKTENSLHYVNYFLREIAGVWHYYILGG